MQKTMKVIQSLLTCLLLLIGGLANATNNYQDWWWNPAQSGMGLNIGQQNDTIFVAWFNYGDDTKASFLTMGGVLSGNTLTGPLLRNTGPVPGPNYNPSLVKQTAVGTATITFNSNNDATLTYSYDNKGGTMALQRFSFASPNLMQTFNVISNYSGCDPASPGQNEMRIITGKEQIGNKFTVVTPRLDGTDVCTLSMTSQQRGSKLNAQGTSNCAGDPETFDFVMEDLLIQSDFLSYAYTVSRKQGSSLICVEKGKVAGVVQKTAGPSYDLATAFKNQLLQGFSKTFNVTGDCKGTWSGTDTPAMKTTWQGQSVYAVGTTNIFNVPNCSLGVSGTHSSITYYDMNFIEVAKFDSDGTYSEFVKTPRPASVKVGDSGTLGTWYHWSNNSKSQSWGTDVHTFVVEADTASTALLNVIDRTYTNINLLDITSQIRFKLNSNDTLEWYSVTIDFANNKGHLFLQ
jgi:hypothetical protein